MKYTAHQIKHQLQVIKSVLNGFAWGASLEEVMAVSRLPIELRTFQRRLAHLKEQGDIYVSGDTRSTRYHLAVSIPMNVVNEAEEAYGDHPHTAIPLSATGRQIMAAISMPLSRRTPVGYNRQFLEIYQPNKDYYLSKDERQKLYRLGFTARTNQPAGTYAREILNRLLIDLSWNSSRLEGNTYSLLDTERLLSIGEVSDTKTVLEAQMILNHKDAIEFLVEGADEIAFNRYSMLNLHALLSHNLLSEPAASGRLRSKGVGIHQSVFSPLGVPQLIEEMFDLILEKAGQIEDPFEQSFFVMVHLPYLQPFDDVNKRVSRLASNIPLNRHNLAPLSFIDVPNDLYVAGMLGIYELNRIELMKEVFIWAYERSCNRYGDVRQMLGEPDPFRLKYRNQMRSLITEIVSNQLSSARVVAQIQSVAANLPLTDRAKFAEVVETELLSLHEGNFARYMVRPSVFKAWKENWRK